MLIPIPQLVTAGLRDVHGILHLGAHKGEEADAYDREIPWADRPRVVWVEANPAVIPALNRNVAHRPGHSVIEAVIDETVREVTFHEASNGQSSSVLPLGTHATEHPDVTYVDEWQVTTTTVDLLVEQHRLDGINMLCADLQGYEDRALRGATQFLAHIDWAYLEVNRKPLYETAGLVGEVSALLPGFKSRASAWTRHGWGDMFFGRIDCPGRNQQ